jgi:hypothetical protein
VGKGMAIRMALDLGLNVSSENWVQNGTKVFDERESELRERTWFGCVLLERQLNSSFIWIWAVLIVGT